MKLQKTGVVLITTILTAAMCMEAGAVTPTASYEFNSGIARSQGALFHYQDFFYFITNNDNEKFYLRKGQLNMDGSMSVDTQGMKPITLNNIARNFPQTYKALEYKGKIYLFYAAGGYRGSSYETYLRYVTTTDPQSESIGWDTNGGEGYKLSNEGDEYYLYAQEKEGYPQVYLTFEAVVSNERLFVFFHGGKSGTSIKILMYDGEKWHFDDMPEPQLIDDKGPTRMYGMLSATTFYRGDENKEYICLGTFYKSTYFAIFVIDEDGNWKVEHRLESGSYHGEKNVYPHLGIAAVAGTLRGYDSLQGRETVHFFGHYPGSKGLIAHLKIDMANGNAWGWSGDAKLPISYSGELYAPILSIKIPVTIDDDKTRQYVLLLTYDHKSGGTDYSVIYSIESDQLIRINRSPEVDTGYGETKEKGSWTVLGVVEGVPPFSRNGVDADNTTSTVKFEKSKTEEITCDVSYGVAASAEVTVGGSGKVWTAKVTGKVREALMKKHSTSYSETKSIKFDLTNAQKNKNGDYGWLLVSKPTLQNTTYDWKSQDGSNQFGLIHITSVTATDLTFETYKLTDPPNGMKARRPGGDLDYWQYKFDPTHISYDNIVKYLLDAVKGDVRGGSSASSLKISQSEVESSSSKTSLKLSAEGGAKNILTIKVEGEVELEFGTKFNTSFSDLVEASLDLPLPASEEDDYYCTITDKPYWYVPQDAAKLSDYTEETRPYWISDEYATSEGMPWCLTWKVLATEIGCDLGKIGAGLD